MSCDISHQRQPNRSVVAWDRRLAACAARLCAAALRTLVPVTVLSSIANYLQYHCFSQRPVDPPRVLLGCLGTSGSLYVKCLCAMKMQHQAGQCVFAIHYTHWQDGAAAWTEPPVV